MVVEKVVEATNEVLSAVQSLVPLLRNHKVIPTREALSALVSSGVSTLLMARYPDTSSEIAGMLCLSVYRAPTGIRSVVEDVVVHERYRGHGIAQSMLKQAVELAREAGADSVSLTSNPAREAANRLYQKMGFIKRDTNSYFYKLK